MWETISDASKINLFADKASSLDVSQLLAFERNYSSSVSASLEKIKNTWYVDREEKIPEANAAFLRGKIIRDNDVSSWTRDNLISVRRFIKLLSPIEISKIKKEHFNREAVMNIVTKSLSLSQKTVIFGKFRDQMEDSSRDREALPELLYTALSSHELLNSAPFFTWSTDKTKLLENSELFTQGQMSALHEVLRPGIWHYANTSAVLIHHPKCLDDDPPRKVMKNRAAILGGIDSVPDSFYKISESLQSTPKHLRMAWIESIFPAGETIDTNVLLDIPDKGESPRVTNNDPEHALAHVFNKFFSNSNNKDDEFPKCKLPSLVLSGLSCKHIEDIKPEDTLEVLAMFR